VFASFFFSLSRSSSSFLFLLSFALPSLPSSLFPYAVQLSQYTTTTTMHSPFFAAKHKYKEEEEKTEEMAPETQRKRAFLTKKSDITLHQHAQQEEWGNF